MSSSNNGSYCHAHTANGSDFGISSKYNGIVENVIINLIYYAIGMVVFLFLRQYVADSYLADKQVTQKCDYFYYFFQLLVGCTFRFRRFITSPTQLTPDEILNLNPLRIVISVFKLNLRDIGQKCGPVATRYLYFQRFLIGYVFILCILNLAIILPINFQGKLGVNSSAFAATTIMNLEADSPFLWAHVVVQFIGTMVGFGIFFQFVRSSDILKKYKQRETLMIRKIPIQYCTYESLISFFREVLPELNVKDVAICYKLWDVQKSDEARKINSVLLQSCDELEQTFGRAGTVTKCCSGHLCAKFCCVCGPQYEAREYYTEIYNHIDRDFKKKAELAMKKPTGIIFVTLANEQQAAIAKNYIKSRHGTKRSKEPLSLVEEEFELHKWISKYAPEAENIQWQNMREKNFTWYLRIVLLNASLFYLAIMLSTPSIVLNTVDKMLTSTEILNINIASILPVFFVNILPVMILKMVSSVLPIVIGYTGHLERHWTYSTMGHVHILKSFVFVLFTVLIIPSLGLMSITGFLRWIFEIDANLDGQKFQWQCIFLPDNGAFYVNYMITSSFISTINDLLRLPDLIGLWLNLLMAESAVKRHALYSLYTIPYTYNGAYASLAVSLCIVTTYGVICPLVTPVGLLYFIMKYYTDKYLIYYTSSPTLLKQRVHLTAVKCVSLGSIVPAAFLFLFTILKSTNLKRPLAIVQLTILIITVLLAVIGRYLPLDKVLETTLSPLRTIPFLNEYLVGEQQLKFDRYYPHYLLPMIQDGYGTHQETSSPNLSEKLIDLTETKIDDAQQKNEDIHEDMVGSSEIKDKV